MILGITPARGGSKGIPRKNIKTICGKPLLAWTIEAALNSKLLDDYVVTTEDTEIAQIAVKYGVKVLQRPVELASDESTTLSVLQNVLEQVWADIVVVLQATSPVRNDDLIDSCIKRFLDSGADSLATGFICKYVEYGKSLQRRQDIKGFFYDDGNIYIMNSTLIKAGERFGQKIERVLLDNEQNVDIDDEFGFWLAEQVLLKRSKGQLY
ncbi:MAG TPA: acylneuraminate cytidylyltransferase family protein [Desulfotomaculum sp.]|nr:MAG: Cytidylyltransferase domain protein [Desulfotomaculum sp. 46_296]HAG10145.1 acylneuraminate cytidylyltransferase family protein [Desulfotomaculum sp.]HBY03664.1 acylneuraminate cytidylyltransferase family protein [Desulfotomaculum sp.]